MPKRHHSLSNEIESIVKRELEGEIELKRQITYFTLGTTSLLNTGFVAGLSTIAQGNTGTSLQNDRTGNQILAKTLRFKADVYSLPAVTDSTLDTDIDILTTLRIIFFTWIPLIAPSISTIPVGAILDIGDILGAGYENVSPHLQQRGSKQFHIHSDTTHTIGPRAITTSWNGTGLTHHSWPELTRIDHTFHLNHIIDYQTSTSGQVAIGHVCALFLTNQTTGTRTPLINAAAALYYTDA